MSGASRGSWPVVLALARRDDRERAFGDYVADKVQAGQFASFVNCRDDARTRHAVQRFVERLRQTGEDRPLAERAMARSRIVEAIASEK